MTILLTTHYMDEAEVCSKIVIMDHGKIVAHDTPENLKHQYTGTEVDVVCTQTEPFMAALQERGGPIEKMGTSWFSIQRKRLPHWKVYQHTRLQSQTLK